MSRRKDQKNAGTDCRMEAVCARSASAEAGLEPETAENRDSSEDRNWKYPEGAALYIS